MGLNAKCYGTRKMGGSIWQDGSGKGFMGKVAFFTRFEILAVYI